MSDEKPITPTPTPFKRFTPEDLNALPKLDIIQYAHTVRHLAKDIENHFEIPYIVPIVQSAHESANGNSGLARNHCNLFGITATKSWTDRGKPVANLPTFEYIEGKRVELKREFRKYPDWHASFVDWAVLISTLNVYKEAYAFFRDGDVPAGIAAMAKAYATDPHYARALASKYHVMLELSKQPGSKL